MQPMANGLYLSPSRSLFPSPTHTHLVYPGRHCGAEEQHLSPLLPLLPARLEHLHVAPAAAEAEAEAAEAAK